jgi:capsular polysaccharide biosynthesis protein
LSDHVTDLRWTAATLRRRSRVLIAAALLGLVGGVAYVMMSPPPLTSTTLVLLPTPALAESSSSDVDTQVRIALSNSVLDRAGQSVTPALSPRSVEKKVKVTAPTNQLIQVDATSTNAAQAQALSEAVADSYVGYVTNTAKEVTAAALADLSVRKDNLQSQITQLQREITATTKRQRAADPNSQDGKTEAQLLARLQAEQANLSLQLDKVQDKIATGTPAATVSAGTSVVQRATEATGPATWLRLLVWAPFAALACTILAVVVVLATAWRDPRVRFRDEIADAIGSPVLASVRSRPQRSVAGWSTLLETYEATPVESWAFRQLLRTLVPAGRNGEPGVGAKLNHPDSLTVVSLAGDGRGVALGPQLAAFAASQGVATHLKTMAGDERVAALWAACVTERDTPLRPDLYISEVPDGAKIDMTISLLVVDRERPQLGDIAASASTILAVASGTATEQELARVALAVDDASRGIDGILVADPDHSDPTSGRHTMDERSRQVALPVRLTGIALSNGAASDHQRSRS